MSTFDGRKVVFLHIPKTAGTSIKEYFYQFFTQVEICPHWDEFLFQKNIEENIRSFRFFHGHFNHDILKFFPRDTVIFTFLRAPLEQVFSSYYYAKALTELQVQSLAPQARASAMAARTLPIAEYLRLDDPSVIRMLSNVQTRKLANSSNYHIDKVNWESLAEMAIANSRRFDFVGRVENIRADVEELVRLFSLSPHLTLRTANISRAVREPVGDEAVAAGQRFIQADRILYDHWLNAPMLS